MTRSDLPYPDDEGRTHYEDCWRERGHHNCAVTHVEALERELAEVRSEALAFKELWEKQCHFTEHVVAADRDRLAAELAEARETINYANEMCERALKYRDEAEGERDAFAAENERLRDRLNIRQDENGQYYDEIDVLRAALNGGNDGSA